MTTQATLPQEEDVTLSSLAREIFEECGDVELTTDWLIRKLRREHELFRRLMSVIVRDAVRFHAGTAMRTDRRVNLQRASAEADANADVVVGLDREAAEAIANEHKYAFLDFWIGSGLRLRDATREQVMAKAAAYDVLSRDTGRKSRWLALIGQSVPDDQKVGDVLDEDRVAELWRETA